MANTGGTDHGPRTQTRPPRAARSPARMLLAGLVAGSAQAAQPGAEEPLLSLQCRGQCELVCEVNGARTSYPASGRVEIFAGNGGVQFVRLNEGRWLRLGNDSNCLFDGFE